MNRIAPALLVAILATTVPPEASALITGGEGNTPIRDPGWPAGAAVIFNHAGRIAWWEGPPFGGGQWHAECRGDARALNAVLADLARVDAKVKRLVVHDGTGYSFWLAPNREPEKLEKARMDWVVTVWQPDRWEMLRKLPGDLNPTDPGQITPPLQVDVYTGSMDWAGVTVPEGIEVVDRRLAAHGFTPEDGIVLEGKVTELATDRPVAATIRLQGVEPQEGGGYRYPDIAEAKADAEGHWVIKGAPAGWFRIVVEADDFVPRVAGHARFDGQPGWHPFDSRLAHPAVVSGRVTDDAGKPLADVEVSLGNVRPQSGGRYESPVDYAARTDAEGRFRIDRVPVGTATAWARKPGYVGPGLGVSVTTPEDDATLQMSRAASLRVTVDFAGRARPDGYIVNLEPEGGNVVGSYGGSGDIDVQDRRTFEPVPPGRYVVWGRPNPGSDAEQTEFVTVELKAGQTAEVTLKAK